jgi:hypothetical protein
MMKLVAWQTLRMRLCLGAVGIALIVAIPSLKAGDEPPRDLPAGVKVSLVQATNTYFLGENVLLHYHLENTGDTPFKLSVGGDYRGGTRAHRFKVSATDAQGRPVADPSPVQWDMGGLSPMATLTNGASWDEQVWLVRYCRFEEPGTYTVRVFHDLGLGPKRDHDPRELTTTIHFKAPTEAEARELVAAMLKPSHDSGTTWGKRGRSVPDFGVLRHPAYLPALKDLARSGSSEALRGIDGIITVEATKFLADWQAEATALRQDQQATDSAGIAQALAAGNYLLKRLSKANVSRSAWGMEGKEEQEKLDQRFRQTWRPEFAKPIIDSALFLLSQTNREAIRLACAELASLGKPENVPAMLKTLDFAVAHTTDLYRGDHGYPQPVSVCSDLAGLIESLMPPGNPTAPDSPGKALLFARSLGRRTNDQAAWEQPAVALLHDPLPFLRAQTLASLPEQLPKRVADLIATLMQDPDVTVQKQAFNVAERMDRPEHRDIALKVLAVAKDHWLFESADRLARKHEAGFECAEIWVQRFDEKLDEPGPEAMAFYAIQSLWAITTGGHVSGSFNSRENHTAYKTRWAKFLADHKQELKAGRQFKLGEGGLTKDLLTDGMEYYPPKP